MATLSVGANDIDFPGIIFNCILESHLPGGPPKRTCDEQKEITWGLLVDPGLAEKISHTIKKVVDKGRKGPIGDKFKLYVTGFPQFFSLETDECDKVTFGRTANPKPDGQKHIELTGKVRKEYNDKLWLFHYPYNEPDPKELMDPLEKAAAKVALGKN